MTSDASAGSTTAGDEVVLRTAALDSLVAAELIAELNAELDQMYPEPGANHFELPTADVFLVAWLRHPDGTERALGCGALRVIEPGVGEIKRMYVRPEARGRRVAGAVLDALERRAGVLGCRRLVLETGNRQNAAMVLYLRHGFTPIPCWGEYLDSAETSTCLGKELEAAPNAAPVTDAPGTAAPGTATERTGAPAAAPVNGPEGEPTNDRAFRVGPSHVAIAVAAVVTMVLLAVIVIPKLTGSSDRASTPYDTDVYEVRAGDTISSVATMHAITDDALEQANDLTSTSSLDPGTQLTVPLPTPTGSLPDGLAGNEELLGLRPTFEKWADEYDVPLPLLEGDLWQESNWNNDAVSSDGAIGIGQLLPSTAQYINDTLLDGADLDPNDPSDNIQLSAAYFQYLLEGSDGSWAEALASYFAGPTSAQNSAWDEATVAYVTKGMGFIADFVPED